MVIAVRTERRSDGLEIVKQADTDPDRIRLQREATMLRRAAHPGVVEVVSESPTTLRLRHAGTALARLGPLAPDHAAAVVRSVAATVGDLHQLGLVHGRIRADHVVLDVKGRPRLCGFAEANDGTDDRRAADVADLGALLDHLLDAAGDVMWSPDLRGLRSASRRKRALAGFRAAATAAQQPEPHLRPTARQLAAALLDALPELQLPVTPGDETDDPGGGTDAAPPATSSRPDRPRTFAEIPADIDPTADLGWTDDDLFFLADVGDDDDLDPGHDTDDRDRDHVATQPDADAASEHEHEPEPEPEPEHEPVSASDPAPAAAATPAASADGPTITIRPAAPTAEPAEPAGLDRRLLAALAAVVLIVGVVAGSMIARTVRPFGGDDPTPTTAGGDPTSTPDATTTTSAIAPLATPPTFPAQCDVPVAPGPDVDDDGCPDAVVLDGRTAQVGSISVDLGEDGDLVALGDPDCDGIVTPAVLRPSTGEVFVFVEWSLSQPVEIAPSAVVAGADAIRSPAPCAPFVVDVDGTAIEVGR